MIRFYLYFSDLLKSKRCYNSIFYQFMFMQPSEKVIKRGEDFAYLTPLIKGEHSKGLKIQVEESCKTSYE